MSCRVKRLLKRKILHVLLTLPGLGLLLWSRVKVFLVGVVHLHLAGLAADLGVDVLPEFVDLHILKRRLHGSLRLWPTGKVLAHEPGEHVIVSVEFSLLVSDVVRVIRLLIQLRQTVGRLLESLLQSLQVLLCS